MQTETGYFTKKIAPLQRGSLHRLREWLILSDSVIPVGVDTKINEHGYHRWLMEIFGESCFAVYWGVDTVVAMVMNVMVGGSSH